jgi:hypothetical protein
MLVCTKCNTEKDEDQFYHCKTGGRLIDRWFGDTQVRLTCWCRDCYALYYANNAERQRHTNRKAAVKRRYGIDLDVYETLIAKGCAICKTTERRIVLDHCHLSGAVREALCDDCNQLLGRAKDDPIILRMAALYLERHKAT